MFLGSAPFLKCVELRDDSRLFAQERVFPNVDKRVLRVSFGFPFGSLIPWEVPVLWSGSGWSLFVVCLPLPFTGLLRTVKSLIRHEKGTRLAS